MKSKDFFTKEEAEKTDIPTDGTYVEHYLGCGAVFKRHHMYVGRCPSCNGEIRGGRFS